MESLNEQEAMRVLKAAAALDALRATGSRSAALAPGRLPVPMPAQHLHQQQQHQPQQAPAIDCPPSPAQALGEDVWREMAETEGGEQKRNGDLDSWLDVFRSTAGNVRNAWRSRERPTFESLAFGWLALARKHEPLQCAPPTAAGDEVPDTALLAQWQSEAQWVQAAYQVAGAAAAAPAVSPMQTSPVASVAVRVVAAAAAVPAGAAVEAAVGAAAVASPEQRLIQTLALQHSDLLACCPEPRGWRPAFFLAAHHESRSIRLVVRGSSALADLLNPAASGTAALGPGLAHGGMLAAARALKAEVGERLGAAVGAHPGYGLRCIGHSEGAGIAALLLMLLASPDDGAGGGSDGAEGGGGGGGRAEERAVDGPALMPPPPPPLLLPGGVSVRATCFSPPPMVTSELAEAHAGAIDSVVYNADLWSRCSATSLRRLTGEMSAASQEVLARSELAQALRRSGALGLANHLVAAALCRCQPPRDLPSGGTGPAPAAAAAALIAVPSRGLLGEGLVSPGPAALTRPPPAALAIVTMANASPGVKAAAASAGAAALLVHPGGRAGQLAALGSQLKVATNAGCGGTSVEPSVGIIAKLTGAAISPPSASPPPIPAPPGPPLPPPAAPPIPVGPPSGTLPPLASATVIAGGGGCAATAAARPSGRDSPTRRLTDLPASVGVLSPPPLVAAAAAAAASAQSQHVTGATAASPMHTRRCLSSFPAVSREPRAAAAAALGIGAALLSYSEDADGCGGGAAAAAAVAPAACAPLLEPISSPPPLPGTRDAIGTGDSPTGAAAAAATASSSAGRQILPSLSLTSCSPPQPQSPQSPLLIRQVTHLEPQESPTTTAAAAEFLTERSLRSIAPLPLPDGVSHKHLQPPLPVQLPQLSQGVPDLALPDGAPELLVPGVVYLIERKGADANASFRLLRNVDRAHLGRVLLKRSMLRDHLMSHYAAALDRIVQQQHQ